MIYNRSTKEEPGEIVKAESSSWSHRFWICGKVFKEKKVDKQHIANCGSWEILGREAFQIDCDHDLPPRMACGVIRILA